MFTLYALDSLLNLPGGATEADIKKAMDGHILGREHQRGGVQSGSLAGSWVGSW